MLIVMVHYMVVVYVFVLRSVGGWLVMARVLFVGLCINAIMFIFLVNLPVVIF